MKIPRGVRQSRRGDRRSARNEATAKSCHRPIVSKPRVQKALRSLVVKGQGLLWDPQPGWRSQCQPRVRRPIPLGSADRRSAVATVRRAATRCADRAHPRTHAHRSLVSPEDRAHRPFRGGRPSGPDADAGASPRREADGLRRRRHRDAHRHAARRRAAAAQPVGSSLTRWSTLAAEFEAVTVFTL